MSDHNAPCNCDQSGELESVIAGLAKSIQLVLAIDNLCTGSRAQLNGALELAGFAPVAKVSSSHACPVCAAVAKVAQCVDLAMEGLWIGNVSHELSQHLSMAADAGMVWLDNEYWRLTSVDNCVDTDV